MTIKAWWKSTTLWFNSALGSVALLLPDLTAQLPVLKQNLPDDIYKWLLYVVVFGNVLLRKRTSTAIGMRDAG